MAAKYWRQKTWGGEQGSETGSAYSPALPKRHLEIVFHLQTKQVHLIVVSHREVAESSPDTTRTQVTSLNTKKKYVAFFLFPKKVSWITLITG